MNKILSLATLEDAFHQDLAWRRKELSSLYLAAVVAKSSSDSQIGAIRAGIVLSYAHLEGFTRHAARCYFEYVRSRNLNYCDLGHNFLALKLSRLVSQQSTKASYYHEAVKLLTANLGAVADLPQPDVIKANSNLSFAQLSEILYCINIDPSPFSLKENFLDEIVLERRNAIAHGEFRKPTLADYLEIHNGVIEIIDQLEQILIQAANSQSFRV